MPTHPAAEPRDVIVGTTASTAITNEPKVAPVDVELLIDGEDGVPPKVL